MNPRLVRRIAFIAGLLSLTILVGTAGFRLIEGYTYFDAFYMTLSTITTVGEQIRPLSHAGRVFNAFLILFGDSAMFLALGAMTQTIIELELDDTYGKRRKRRMIEALQDHFIVCGFGRVGRNASYQLQNAGARFLVMDRDEQRIAKATEGGMLAMAGDATRDEALRAAGVLKAKGLIAALPTDAENLFIILSAKALNPALTVVTRASEEEAGNKLRRAGADTVLTPYAIAGRQLADTLLRPQVVEFLDFARSSIGPEITMEQVSIGAGRETRTRTLQELTEGAAAGVIVLAVRRGDSDTVFHPPMELEVGAGDCLVVMGHRAMLQQLERKLAEKA